ncbi:hypothetical protein TWF694_006868 [Orbilia ellipsospora]|uniref:Uncharacterized protein n=1 Tax=Orbilia ellipsospora TaxID=2528407 RepID=A0AAV9XLG7_9PEZI
MSSEENTTIIDQQLQEHVTFLKEALGNGERMKKEICDVAWSLWKRNLLRCKTTQSLHECKAIAKECRKPTSIISDLQARLEDEIFLLEVHIYEITQEKSDFQGCPGSLDAKHRSWLMPQFLSLYSLGWLRQKSYPPSFLDRSTRTLWLSILATLRDGLY